MGSVSPKKFALSPVEEDVLEDKGDSEDIGDQAIQEEDVVGDHGEIGERLKLEDEGEFVRGVGDPKLPSQKEVDEHYVRGHLPFRDWCPVCIQARGRDMDHKVDKGNERSLPEYSWDYCFPGDE